MNEKEKSCLDCEFIEIADLEFTDDDCVWIEAYCPESKGMLENFRICSIFEEAKDDE